MKLAHGADCVQAFESEPDGETNTDAEDEGGGGGGGGGDAGHALVEPERLAFAEWFPAASYASSANE